MAPYLSSPLVFFLWIKVENALHAIGHRPRRGIYATRDARWAQWVLGTFPQSGTRTCHSS